MRVNFELKFGADSLEEAKKEAYERVAAFLELTIEDVPRAVDLELKVGTFDPEKDAAISPAGPYLVTAYGNLKHSIAKPF